MYRIVVWLHSVLNFIYTKFIKLFLGHVGKNSWVCYPCKLEGDGPKSIYIGSDTRIGSHCVLGSQIHYKGRTFSPEIIIGDKCSLGEYNHITAIGRIVIGDGLLTGRFVTITDNSHGDFKTEDGSVPPASRQLYSKGGVEIGKNVWIGDKATILSGVHIGDNVVIGANAVVNKDIPSNTVFAGVPAKQLWPK